MSALYVRDMVRKWLSDTSLEVPFYDTVNVEQNPTDRNWMTAEFQSTLRDKISFCEWREEGEILVIFTGAPGVGDGELLSAAEKDIKTFMAFRDLTRQLTITGIQAISEYSGGSANSGYQVEVTIEYTYQDLEG
jgi:hypothetical protein